ncbi:hypothetical protein E4T52_08287 [Aureobasidium sp. EXF-3400]|nr:hypothetical protein E4T51_11558 [Aureobasidium sp. EXF-12344]KAI4776766.1 hypothetical protein E4T52_08287 [Aureobasidium sp. EXF-3400]
MHHDTLTGVDQSTESNSVKLTLETLPPEIKNEIFSHLLLAAKVKYSTNGSWPGHKYKFSTTIMRVSKQMKQDATAYLHGQNEFALISSKFFAFAIDRRRFLPAVATGKAARTFKSPAIEATITHVGETLCMCCNPEKHKDKDRATHALFLVADLEHLVRELRLTYHMWSSKPIYIMSEFNATPVEHIPVNVDTQIKVVWKVNPPHRQDLTVPERRARQIRLLNPLDFATGCGKKISVVGVDKDIARKVTEEDMPRILSLDAVGRDLYKLLKAQKMHLDTLLSQEDSPCLHSLIHSYTDLACAGWPLDIIGYWRNATVTRNVNMHGTMISLCLMSLEKLDDEDYQAEVTDSWQMAVLCLVLDCLFTIAQLCLKEGSYAHLKDCVDLITNVECYTFRGNNHQLFPGSLKALLSHYVAWLLMQDGGRATDQAVSQGLDMLQMAREWIHADSEDEVWRHLDADWEFTRRVGAGKAELRSKNFGRSKTSCVNFQGLLSRPRVHNTPVHIKPPREALQGWTTKRKDLKPEVAAHMIEYTDRISKSKFAERSPALAEEALNHGHVAPVILNLLLEPEEMQEGPALPPGMPPGFLAGGFGIQVGPVTTVGQVLADMGMSAPQS